ncbi:nitric-oxide reductase large subunit [Halalkalicoccus sp. GCM10025322]|uniref:nitric-oxide reductase large subunit n=2 Tax=Halococcaceae TaxID=1963270 RepID=UPI002F967371
MGITHILTEAGLIDERDRRRATDYVTDRLERAADVVDDLSTRVRNGTRERAFDSVDVDGLVERAVTDLIGDPDVLAEELLDEHDLSYGTDDPSERALEAFLRRYDLDGARLNERTREAIRDELIAQLDVDPERVLERLGADRSTDSEPNAGMDPSIGHVLTDVRSRLRAELDIEGDQPLHRALDDVLQRDAVEVAHGVERALAEGLARSEGGRPTGTNEHGSSVRPTAAMALAAMTLPSEDGTGDRSVDSVLPELASVLMGGDDGSPPSERVVLELLSTLLLETGASDPDLASLRSALGSERTGARALVALFVANLVAMTLGAWISRERAPPIPDEIRGPEGETVVTDEQVRAGKKAFQTNGLMNHGSILGNGSYFGVDLTADALALKAEFMREYYARRRGGKSFEALDVDGQAVVEERVERELDADAPEGSIARYSAAETYAHRRIRDRYVDRYYGGAPERGIPSGFVDSPDQAERIADFALWTAWMAHTDRPGSDHSYTNDWPYVPGTGNRPTGQVLVWSTISVVLLVAGGGIGVWAYHAFDFAEPTTEIVDVPSPDEVSITPTQYAAAWYVPVAGALFVTQALVGALLAHYYVERTGFFDVGDALDIDVVSLVPFSVGRTWHVNLAVLWITTLWLAGGLFLPGLFAERDPPRQAAGATALLGALVIATVGAFAGVWFGIQGKLGTPEEGELWWWFGSEGLEYLETGRFWKLLLLGALGGWTGLVLRSVRRLDEAPTGLGHFMAYAGGSIALMFGASMLYTPETNMAVTEFWRWWVVHMWVEGVFEFFVTTVISVALVSMDLVEQADAEKAILFEVFTIMAAGIVGVSHHYWWVGLPDVWVPIGTTFSTLEFVPLVFILYRSLGEYRSMKVQGEEFPYKLPLLFIIGSSVWNFVGGGVLGFFINLPVINYYEHGTYLTVAHAHAATFGAFGLLALGLGTYVLRMVTPEAAWDPTWFRGAFWLTNAGLVIMTVASLLPVGFLQLRTAYSDGYAAARSLEFYEQSHVQTLLWARTLGDTPMILGALAFTAAAIRHLYAARRPVTSG